MEIHTQERRERQKRESGDEDKAGGGGGGGGGREYMEREKPETKRLGLMSFFFHFQPQIETMERNMAERSKRLRKVKEKTNTVEDELFGDFCQEIGVANIRQYEERELQVQEDRAKKRLEFENQKLRLQNQLEFERSRDTRGECVVVIHMLGRLK